MRAEQIWAVYFSPTGGTKRIVCEIAERLGVKTGAAVKEIDFTSKESRQKVFSFSENDLVVIGSPVYAGRVPNKIVDDYRTCFKGNGACAVPVVSFGNRSSGGALTELRLILQQNGFKIAGAAAAVSEHVFSPLVGAGRPDEQDEKEIADFADKIAGKLFEDENGSVPAFLNELPDDVYIEPYYTPLQEDGSPAKFLKAKPVTDPAKCTHCGQCVKMCPMGSIDVNVETPGVCIKCQACIKGCPEGARHIEDAQFNSHVRMLEKNYTGRTDNEFIV